MRKLSELIRERAKLDQELEQFKHLLTIQLVDIVESSELYRRMDLLTAAVVVERELNRIKSKVIHFGGLPIKTIGDALLSRFEDPVAGVRSAVDIQRWLAARKNGAGYRIRVRIVLNRDVGLLEGGKIYGDVINLAAHIEKIAAADTILITRSVYDAVRRARPPYAQSRSRRGSGPIRGGVEAGPQKICALNGPAVGAFRASEWISPPHFVGTKSFVYLCESHR